MGNKDNNKQRNIYYITEMCLTIIWLQIIKIHSERKKPTTYLKFSSKHSVSTENKKISFANFVFSE